MDDTYGDALMTASPNIQNYVTRYDSIPTEDVAALTELVVLLRKLPAETPIDRLWLDLLVARFDAEHQKGHDTCVRTHDKLSQLSRDAHEHGFYPLEAEIGALVATQLGKHTWCVIDACKGDPAKVNNVPAPGTTKPTGMSNPVLSGMSTVFTAGDALIGWLKRLIWRR